VVIAQEYATMQRQRWVWTLGLTLFSLTAPVRADVFYQETNLVTSDQATWAAPNTDSNLQNPWGMSASAGSPWWVSNQVSNNSTLYNKSGVPQGGTPPLVVTIPTAGNTGFGTGPTGQVNNNATIGFTTSTGATPPFIFATLQGTIAAWIPSSGTPQPATTIVNPVDSGSSYTGLSVLSSTFTGSAANYLLAANDGAGRIDVFDNHFNYVSGTGGIAAGSFSDPTLTNAGFTPYNVKAINGLVYVAYENTANNGGAIAVFTSLGVLVSNLSQNGDGGPLSHPWGLAIAPSNFGQFSGDLLVGNEHDGLIHAFDPVHGTLLGTMSMVDGGGNPVNLGFGLWSLEFGKGSAATGATNTLFFTLGIDGETGGLVGSIQSVPEPASLSLIVVGGAVAAGYRRVRNRRIAASA
jgi:uncharacterized protein (TIGR03118 family)